MNEVFVEISGRWLQVVLAGTTTLLLASEPNADHRDIGLLWRDPRDIGPGWEAPVSMVTQARIMRRSILSELCKEASI